MQSDVPRHEADGGSAAIAAVLWSIPLFNACGPSEIAVASRLLQPRTDPAGTEFDPSELAASSFLIVRGHAMANDNGVTTRLSQSDLFGLLRFAVGGNQTATVIALTELRLLVADVDAWARLLRLEGVAHALVQGAAATRRRAAVHHDDT